MDVIRRLLISNVASENDLNNNGLVDRLLSWGGRSISIWLPNGTFVWDSGDTVNFEYLVAHRIPYNHNTGSQDKAAKRRMERGNGKEREKKYTRIDWKRTKGVWNKKVRKKR